MAEITVTKENFQSEVMGSPVPVLLDFWATWCGPCRMVAPVVAQIAEDYEGKLKVGKVDVDAQPELAGAFGVQSIPTLVVIKDGKIAQTSVGALPMAEIVKMLTQAGAI